MSLLNNSHLTYNHDFNAPPNNSTLPNETHMPIYAYRCSECGHAKDVLQKMSDAKLTKCPECGHETFSKQITAAGFQLKGDGWYVTDFRGNTNSNEAKSTSIGGETAVTSTPPPALTSTPANPSESTAESPQAPQSKLATQTTN